MTICVVCGAEAKPKAKRCAIHMKTCAIPRCPHPSKQGIYCVYHYRDTAAPVRECCFSSCTNPVAYPHIKCAQHTGMCAIAGCERSCKNGRYCQAHQKNIEHPAEWQFDKQKNGRTTSSGYVVVAMKDPRTGKHRQIGKHRLVMEAHIGRLLLAEETVHHIRRGVVSGAASSAPRSLCGSKSITRRDGSACAISAPSAS